MVPMKVFAMDILKDFSMVAVKVDKKAGSMDCELGNTLDS